MKAVDFSEFTQMFKGDGDGILDLPVLTGQYEDGTPFLISCWEMGWRERLRALLRGRVYLCILGDRHPPVTLVVDPEELYVSETEEQWRRLKRELYAAKEWVEDGTSFPGYRVG